MEIMIYGAINDSRLVWGIYERRKDLNWVKTVTSIDYNMHGLINMINYALDCYKGAKVLLGGYWYDNETLTNKLYEILDNM